MDAIILVSTPVSCTIRFHRTRKKIITIENSYNLRGVIARGPLMFLGSDMRSKSQHLFLNYDFKCVNLLAANLTTLSIRVSIFFLLLFRLQLFLLSPSLMPHRVETSIFSCFPYRLLSFSILLFPPHFPLVICSMTSL